MTGFTPQMDSSPVIWSGIIQGIGLGLVFVPLSTVAFATLPPRLRTEAAALFSLVRNIGSSIGISIVSVFLTRNIQINHTELSAAINPFNPLVDAIMPSRNLVTLKILDNLVNQQSLMISYNDDFRLMMIITLSAVPLVFLLRKAPDVRQMPSAAHAE
jgi:DHA2 family multidrug resistance protein